LLGVRPNEAYPQSEFSLNPGDRLLIYTDGLVEATSPDGREFGEGALHDFVNVHEHLPAEQFAERLLQEVLVWPGNPNSHMQTDDITIVVVDVQPADRFHFTAEPRTT
jgi:phosphoserine phosphatase RsbU/P